MGPAKRARETMLCATPFAKPTRCGGVTGRGRVRARARPVERRRENRGERARARSGGDDAL